MDDHRETGIEKAIEEAMRAGKFENLAGKGKPLDLERNPHADPANEMAHKILKDNNFTLPWLAAGQQIDNDLESLRAELRRTWEWYRQAVQGAHKAFAREEWGRAEARFRAGVAALNQRIFNYNLQIPNPHFERLKLDPDAEIRGIQEADLP